MKRLTPTLLLAVLVVASTAKADSLSLTFDAGLGDTAFIAAPGQSSKEVVAGPYSYYLSNSTQPGINATSTPKVYEGFCIDFNDSIAPGNSAKFQVESLASFNPEGVTPTEGSKIQGLLYQYAIAADPSNPLLALTSPVKGVDADALSIAIWEVVTEKSNGTNQINSNSSTDLSVSGFANGKTSQIVTLANQWLADLSTTTVKANESDVIGYALVDNVSNPLQSQCVVIGFVPEPATLISLAGMSLMGLAVGGVLLRRKREVRIAA